MTPSFGSLPPRLATRSCLLCRKRRRKCDRTLPKCSECTELSRDCHYRVPQKKPPIAGGMQPNGLQRIRPMQQGHQVAISKLNPSENIQLLLAKPSDLQINVPVSSDILHLLGDTHSIQSIQTEYFRAVYGWMPMISKPRFHQTLSKTSTEPRADLVLLLLSMKLLIDYPTRSSRDCMRNKDYLAAKRLHHSIGTAKRFSTQFLQASVMISLYELGHGIYPEVVLSVAANARLGLFLSINKHQSQQMSPAPASWTESEERMRTWWGVMILDRCVSIGNHRRPLSTPELHGNHYIPVDDDAWEQDIPVPNECLVKTEPSNICVSAFAREAHATYLLGQVVKLKQDESKGKILMHDPAQLGSTLEAFALVLMEDIKGEKGYNYAAAVGICHSALMALHTPCSTAQTTEAERLQQLNDRKRAADKILNLGKIMLWRLKLEGAIDLGVIVPVVPECIYQAALFYRSLLRETGEEQYEEAYQIMVDCLKLWDQKWKIAKLYLEELDKDTESRSEQVLSAKSEDRGRHGKCSSFVKTC